MPINWPLWSPECSKLRVPTATKGVFDRLLLSIIIILDIWALRNPKFIGEKKKIFADGSIGAHSCLLYTSPSQRD